MVLLQQAGFGERVRAALADDEVIQHPDIDGGQGTLQPLGDRTISGRGLGVPRGVLMRLLCPVFLCAVLGGQERTSWASGQNRGT